MSAQTKYGFRTQLGAAGGIVDLAPYAIDTFINSEETGKMLFGIGVVQGKNPGQNIAVPTKNSDVFEGITVNNRTTEYDLEGHVNIRKNASVGVMRYGRVYARVKTDAKPKYGEPALLITTGEEAGYFTNTADESNTVEINGRFLGEVDDSTQIAIIELFNSAVPSKKA